MIQEPGAKNPATLQRDGQKLKNPIEKMFYERHVYHLSTGAGFRNHPKMMKLL